MASGELAKPVISGEYVLAEVPRSALLPIAADGLDPHHPSLKLREYASHLQAGIKREEESNAVRFDKKPDPDIDKHIVDTIMQMPGIKDMKLPMTEVQSHSAPLAPAAAKSIDSLTPR